MPWSKEQKLEFLLRAPWTISLEISEDGERLLVVREIPAVVGSGETDSEIERDFWESLEETLKAYLHFEDVVPRPVGVAGFPWEANAKQVAASTVVDAGGRSIQQASATSAPVVEPDLVAA